MKINKINEMLENGDIPNLFNYSIEREIIDWDKVHYTSYYNSFDFFARKLPNGWQSIKGFDQVIQDMADATTSPLEEMNERINESINILNERNLDEEADKAEWVDFTEFEHIFKKI